MLHSGCSDFVITATKGKRLNLCFWVSHVDHGQLNYSKHCKPIFMSFLKRSGISKSESAYISGGDLDIFVNSESLSMIHGQLCQVLCIRQVALAISAEVLVL